jgi:multisubunit Na+/H+ antiporter MnhE subunit
LAEFVLWWLVLAAMWLATLSTYSGGELLLAGSCALPGAAAVVAARRVLGASWRPSWRWLRWLVAIPVTAVTDTAKVVIRPKPAHRSIALPDRDAGAEAAATLAVNATPGTVVTDVRDGELRVHALSARPSLLERVVRR